ncbi:MAG: ABC transporter ATP-binding protein [Lachnospiraceae bacterium]|nr:ABC transporter ATP-binding protein [Lachnospiraceae bacterium]
MAEEKVREIKGPGNRRQMGPRPKVENPGKLFKRLMSYVLRDYKLHFFIVLICIVVTCISNVRGTMFTRNLIDDYIEPMLQNKSSDYSALLKAMRNVAFFYGAGIIAAFIQSRLMIYVSQGTMRNLRLELFSHMETLPIKYFDTHSHGDIMSIYTNDIDTLRQMISQSLPQIYSSAITIVSILTMMISLSIPLTGLTILMVGVMMFASSKAIKISGSSFVAQQRDIGKLNGFIEETMSGEKVVKVFGHEEETIRAFDEMNEALYESVYKANACSNILGPLSSQISNLSYVLCALVGGLMALNSYVGFTVGGLASFLTLNKNISMPINQVTMQFNSIISALAGAERIFKLLDEESEKDEGYVTLVRSKEIDGEIAETEERTGKWAWKHFHRAEGTTTYVPLMGDITFNGVDFGYSDEKIVLHDIWLHAKPGEKIALVGSTGAGKTTITNLINRFYDIQDGKIRFDNININKIKKAELRRSLGIVLQDVHLFTGTVKENIRYGRLDATDQEVEGAARLANADRFIKHLPEGYDTMLTEDGANLSQGQRQLLSIARAAIADPPALILDEATSSIDTRTEKIVQEGMDRLMKGRTTFVIAHRLSTIKNSDRIVVLEQGAILEQGTHDELLSKQGRYYHLYTGI